MKMISVSSSAIAAVGYDPATRHMQIKFKNSGTYSFCGVPQQIFDGLLSANSKGRYYDQYIRGRYHC
jgi:KTSC domain